MAAHSLCKHCYSNVCPHWGRFHWCWSCSLHRFTRHPVAGGKTGMFNATFAFTSLRMKSQMSKETNTTESLVFSAKMATHLTFWHYRLARICVVTIKTICWARFPPHISWTTLVMTLLIPAISADQVQRNVRAAWRSPSPICSRLDTHRALRSDILSFLLLSSETVCFVFACFFATQGPVFFYYGLTNYFQNQRKYGASKDDNQLYGDLDYFKVRRYTFLKKNSRRAKQNTRSKRHIFIAALAVCLGRLSCWKAFCSL